MQIYADILHKAKLFDKGILNQQHLKKLGNLTTKTLLQEQSKIFSFLQEKKKSFFELLELFNSTRFNC